MSEFRRIVNVVPLTRVKMSGPQIFTYAVPLDFLGQIRPGHLVQIPFGSRILNGITTSFEMHRLPEEAKKLKELKKLLDPSPVATPQNLALAQWIAEYYFTPLGLALKAMLPKFAARPKKPDLVGFEVFNPDFVLTEHQRLAVSQISSALQTHKQFLLKGVTGSGKTEVYMHIIERLMDAGKQIIILVPEISLSAQAIERYSRRFGMEKIALLHSRLRDSERLWMWREIRNNSKKIIIGPRSSVFAPVQDLGLVILDEEHDQSFKQFDQNPKYHARKVAQKLAEIWNCPLILGDATPSVETYFDARAGKIKLLALPHRIKADMGLPRVQVVNMRHESLKGDKSVFSEYLKLAILDQLKSGRQVILFINRRGASPVVMCRDCGFSPLCDDCATRLVWHSSIGKLLCHHCGKRYSLAVSCPNCSGTRFGFWGAATQSVEESLRGFLAKELGTHDMPVISRMDQDSVAPSGELNRIYNDWTSGKIQILIGTQIISKGWDVPGVGLVGIISGDTSLHLPDFRSNERTFQILTQVAGRTGRGSEHGLVILQTFLPENYAIESAKTHSYERFYEKEIQFRQRYLYPPFCKLVKLTISGTSASETLDKSRAVLRKLLAARNAKAQIMGPAPAFIFKLRGKFRYQIFLKLPNDTEMQSVLLKSLPSDIDIDVDPESLL